MENRIEEIIRLDEQIDSMSLQGTSAYQFGTKQKLSVVDKKILEYYKEMVDVIIEILNEKNTKDIKVISNCTHSIYLYKWSIYQSLSNY